MGTDNINVFYRIQGKFRDQMSKTATRKFDLFPSQVYLLRYW